MFDLRKETKAITMNKEVVMTKIENMELVLDFAQFCNELDKEEGTSTYDPRSFALLMVAITEEEV